MCSKKLNKKDSTDSRISIFQIYARFFKTPVPVNQKSLPPTNSQTTRQQFFKPFLFPGGSSINCEL